MIGRRQLQRMMRTSLVSLILAFLVLPAVALRACPMTGFTTAAACCCCDDEAKPDSDVVERNRKSCCDAAAVAPELDAVAGTWTSPLATPAVANTRLAMAGPPFVRELPPRVRGPPGPPSAPVYLMHQSLLL